MKKIYQITEDMTPENGGVFTVINNLQNYLNNNSTFFLSEVLTNIKDKNDNYKTFTPEKKLWNYSSQLKTYLESTINNIDIFHLHGVFMYTQYISSKICVKNNKPFIVSPHGMLEPWHLNDKKIKKLLYIKLVLNNTLTKAKFLHAITPLEKENLFRLTKHKQIIEIPNFIDHNSIPKELKTLDQEEYLLFLSRLHPKKGLGLLIDALSKIENKTIKLKIVGSENSYSDSLKIKIKQLDLANRIEFCGGVFGNEKYEIFANAKALVVPSFSEAIGMVNLEAAVCKTPVLTTFNTGINSEWKNNGGLMINPNLQELVKSLNEITSWSKTERNQRGDMLSNYTINNYSWEKKGHLWNDLYNQM